jgi:hypothetical protein
MIYMGLPEDPLVLAAIGKIALRHGQLDYSLKMAVKTLTNTTIPEAIDATERQSSRDLRERIRRLARKRVGEDDALVRLDALLERARRATDRRNELLHGLWAQELDGGSVIRARGIEFEPIPTVKDLEAVADALAQIAKDLNFARLDGFLRDALAN